MVFLWPSHIYLEKPLRVVVVWPASSDGQRQRRPNPGVRTCGRPRRKIGRATRTNGRACCWLREPGRRRRCPLPPTAGDPGHVIARESSWVPQQRYLSDERSSRHSLRGTPPNASTTSERASARPSSPRPLTASGVCFPAPSSSISDDDDVRTSCSERGVVGVGCAGGAARGAAAADGGVRPRGLCVRSAGQSAAVRSDYS